MDSVNISLSMFVTIMTGVAVAFGWGFMFLFNYTKTVKVDSKEETVELRAGVEKDIDGIRAYMAEEFKALWIAMNVAKDNHAKHQISCLSTFAKGTAIDSLKSDLDGRLGRIEDLLGRLVEKGLS